jgi:hypothetical protein
MIPEKISVRLGDLREPVGDWCDKHGTSPSEFTRVAIAEKLGREAPTMQAGNPIIGQQAIERAKKRKRTKKAKKS